MSITRHEFYKIKISHSIFYVLLFQFQKFLDSNQFSWSSNLLNITLLEFTWFLFYTDIEKKLSGWGDWLPQIKDKAADKGIEQDAKLYFPFYSHELFLFD